GDWPVAGPEPDLRLRRRADQRPVLGEWAEGDRVVARRRPRTPGFDSGRLARPPHPPVRGRVLPPGRRPPGTATLALNRSRETGVGSQKMHSDIARGLVRLLTPDS